MYNEFLKSNGDIDSYFPFPNLMAYIDPGLAVYVVIWKRTDLSKSRQRNIRNLGCDIKIQINYRSAHAHDHEIQYSVVYISILTILQHI